MSDERELTPREKRFVAAYCANGFNASKAALAANPKLTEGSAGNGGYRFLRDERVRAAIRKVVEDELGDVKDVLHKKIIDVYLRRAFYNPADFVNEDGELVRPLEELGPDAVVIDQITRKDSKKGIYSTVTLADRERALDQLGKYISLIKSEGGEGENTGVRVIVVSHDAKMSVEDWNEKIGGKQGSESGDAGLEAST